MIRFLQSGNRAVKYFIGAFLLVVCVSMVVYLIPGLTGSDLIGGGVMAKVGGEEVRTEDVRRIGQELMRQQGQGRPIPDFYVPIFMQRAAQQAFQEAEIRYEANRLGLTVSDEELRDELRTGPDAPFLFPGGKWIGQDEYEKLLTRVGTTVDAFEQRERMTLLERKLFAAITAAVDASPAEIEKLYKEQNTRIKFDYAVLNLQDLQKNIKPTETELKAFFEAHKAGYQGRIQEKRQIRYFVIPQKDAQSKVSVTDVEAQQYYSTHQDQYRTPEEVKTRHILISAPSPGPDGKVDQKALDAARAKAQDVLNQVRAGGDFAALADKYSEDPGNENPKGVKHGGDLPWFRKGPPLDPEYEKVAFGQNKGQISDLVKSSYGFHIIQTEDKHAAGVKPFADVKAGLEASLKAQAAGKLLDQMANDAQTTAKAQTLDKAAAKFSVPVIQTSSLNRTDMLPGIGAAPELMRAVFSAAEKSGPQLTPFAQGYAVFEVTKIEPPRMPSLDEVRDAVTNDFKAERARALLQQKVEQLKDRAHAEHDLRKAAKEVGATVKTSDLVDRNATVPDIGPMGGRETGALFSLKTGEISGAISTGAGGVVVAVTERQDASATDEKFAKEKDNLREQIVGRKRQEAIALFMANLEARMEKEGRKKINKAEYDNLTRNKT
ncbi:MAG TPA: peptidyl-prolyl cis-trans isomerase [Verrucomicrobiae bacterium]|jgi:peptidyl-prolyl cis-trans isomerase D|nr:peptidyl-prolyl cis-trans isomerase [Verrucomicrobiae bacterium]